MAVMSDNPKDSTKDSSAAGKWDKSPDSGLYIIWMRLTKATQLQVGALGSYTFAPGLYAYVGSAQKNRRARIARHLRREKPLRWHIDYFRPATDVVAVTLCDGDRVDECRLVDHLVATLGAERACPRFGASDCRCPGHLLLAPDDALYSVTKGIGWPSGTCFMAMELMQ